MNIKTEFLKIISAIQIMEHIKSLTNFGMVLLQLLKINIPNQGK